MTLDIPKNYLVLIAGALWIVAGGMVIWTGFPFFITRLSWLNLLFAAGVFWVFYWFIFRKLVYKHVARIKAAPVAKMPFWKFFDLRSYIVMGVMMSGGMMIRHLHLIPPAVIGPFYSGLGLALFACGTRFVVAYYKKYSLV